MEDPNQALQLVRPGIEDNDAPETVPLLIGSSVEIGVGASFVSLE